MRFKLLTLFAAALLVAACETAPEETAETESTGAGKHPLAQLNLARQMGVEIRRGDPRENRPGCAIVIPEHPSQIEVVDVDLDRLRRSYLRHALSAVGGAGGLRDADLAFLAAETRSTPSYVKEVMSGLPGTTG